MVFRYLYLPAYVVFVHVVGFNARQYQYEDMDNLYSHAELQDDYLKAHNFYNISDEHIPTWLVEPKVEPIVEATPKGDELAMSYETIDEILHIHNELRASVKPTASNMLKMSWNPIAADEAQLYANKCIFKHNNNTDRLVPRLGACGQNIYMSNFKPTWRQVTEAWFNEYKHYNFGPIKATHDIGAPVVGHYTQVVWATSHEVGCGSASCNGNHFYICHYCPTGNIIRRKPYKIGRSCAGCPGKCEGKLCTNACPFVNKYANCNQLVLLYPDEICSKGICKASCRCKNRIF